MKVTIARCLPRGRILTAEEIEISDSWSNRWDDADLHQRSRVDLTEIRRRSRQRSQRNTAGYFCLERGGRGKEQGKENPGRETLQGRSQRQEIRFPQLCPPTPPTSAPFPGQGSGPLPGAAPTGGAAELPIFARCWLAPALPLGGGGAVLLARQRRVCSGLALTVGGERPRGKIRGMESREARAPNLTS